MQIPHPTPAAFGGTPTLKFGLFASGVKENIFFIAAAKPPQ